MRRSYSVNLSTGEGNSWQGMAIAAVICIAFFLVAFCVYKTFKNETADYPHTATGWVIEIQNKQKSKSTYYAPVVAYDNADGERCEVTGRSINMKPHYSVSDSMKVYYNDAGDAVLFHDYLGMLIAAGVLAGFGMLMLIVTGRMIYLFFCPGKPEPQETVFLS